MAERLRIPQAYLDRETAGHFDDFFWYISPHHWTSLAADATATVACDADGTGGVLQLFTDTTDNNEAAVRTTNEVILPAAGKPWEVEARLQFAELTNNGANVCFGAMDVMGAANTIADNGTGIVSSFYGAAIYKLDGGTVWRCATSAGALSSTGTDTASTTTAGGSAYQVLTIRGLPVGRAGVSEVTFFVNGVQLCDANGRPIKHDLTHGSAGTADLDVGAYGKTGTSGEALTVNVDYLYHAQKR